MNKPDQAATSGQRILSFIQRIERMNNEIKGLKSDRSDILHEAKMIGFDTKTILKIVKERKMTQQERDEAEALLDLYKAAIGMLDGTPLGAAALNRLNKKPQAETTDDVEEQTPEPEQQEPEKVEITAEMIDDARTLGMNEATLGKPVTSNPFPALDPRRAAFDEGWCQAAGTDGMDIPDAWKRTPKAKKKPDGGDDE